MRSKTPTPTPVPKSELEGDREPSGPHIRCPLCGWSPRREDEWFCTCGNDWNTFDTGGICPACLHQWTDTQCLSCRRWSPKIDPAQGIILAAFDFQTGSEVPRPPELIDIPVLVDYLDRPQLRKFLEYIELRRAIRALTPAEQLRLRDVAKFRIYGLGHAAGGRDWEDLLSETFSRTLMGATDTKNGRHWNKNVDLVRHLTEAMRSIANSWRRQFTEEENTYLLSELQTRDAEGDEYSPLDNVASRHVPADKCLIEREIEDQIFDVLRGDPDATQVLQGWMDGFRKSEILPKCGLDARRYDAAVRLIRVRLLGRRGGDYEA
jgi:hypothetical protein